MDEGGFILDYLMPAGTSLEETDRVLQHVEQILHSIPEVETTSVARVCNLDLQQLQRQIAVIFLSS